MYVAPSALSLFSALSEFKESDHSAADYLRKNKGMNLADDSIAHFQYKMEDIVMKGAIGNGSYGEVYRAQVNGNIVAVKKLHVRNLKAEQVDAFCKEASLMCQLKHTNIVGFIGAVTEPSNLCIISQTNTAHERSSIGGKAEVVCLCARSMLTLLSCVCFCVCLSSILRSWFPRRSVVVVHDRHELQAENEIRHRRRKRINLRQFSDELQMTWCFLSLALPSFVSVAADGLWVLLFAPSVSVVSCTTAIL